MTVPPTQLPPLTTQHLDQNVRVLDVYYAYLEKVLTQSSTLLPIELALWLELGRYLIPDKPMTNKVRKARAGVACYFNATINQQHQTMTLK